MSYATSFKSFQGHIADLIQNINERRGQIKEDYIRAYLSELPAEELVLDKIISKLELVETWSKDRLTVSWYLRLK